MTKLKKIVIDGEVFMKIELNEQEAHNVRVALRSLIKSPDIDENGMKVLLLLSDKFVEKKVDNSKVKEIKK